MTVFIVLYILFAHWVCDFLFQTDWMGTNKSKNILALLLHTVVYSITMGLFLEILIQNNAFGAQYYYGSIIFGIVMFITHTMTDFITSRVTSRLWEKKKIRSFFDVIGLDQWSHYAAIFITINYLFY